MKKLILFLLLIPGLCYSQKQVINKVYPIDSASNLITYQDVQEVVGNNKKDLYKSAKTWSTVFFPLDNSTIVHDDLDFDKIIIKDNFKSSYPIMVGKNQSFIKYNLTYTVIIYLKNEKYKIEISNFEYKDNIGNSNSAMPVETALKIVSKIIAEQKPDKIDMANAMKSILNQCELRSAAIIRNFEKNMNAPSKENF